MLLCGQLEHTWGGGGGGGGGSHSSLTWLFSTILFSQNHVAGGWCMRLLYAVIGNTNPEVGNLDQESSFPCTLWKL